MILRYRREKNSGRMIRFIRREKRDYILPLLVFFIVLFFLSLSTVDATRRASGHTYIYIYVRLYSRDVCAFKKQSKEQKK